MPGGNSIAMMFQNDKWTAMSSIHSPVHEYGFVMVSTRISVHVHAVSVVSLRMHVHHPAPFASPVLLFMRSALQNLLPFLIVQVESVPIPSHSYTLNHTIPFK